MERIDRLCEKNSRVAQDYQLDVTPDAEHKNAVAIIWQRQASNSQFEKLV